MGDAAHIEAHIQTKAKLLARFKAQGPQVSKNGLPPGQSRVTKWVVLDMRPPDFDFELDEDWRLSISIENSSVTRSLSLKDIQALGPCERIMQDFHCVTSWTALGVEMEGIKFAHLHKHLAIPESYRWMVLRGADGYSSFVSREDAEKDNVMLVWGYWDHKGSKDPLDPQEEMLPLGLEHGGIRVFFPDLYGWKSAKWLVGLHFTEMQPSEGFWELRGWHSRGRVKEQQRYNDPNNRSAIIFYPLEYWLTVWARVYPQGVHAIQKILSGYWGAYLNPHYWVFTALAGPIFPWYLLYHTLMYGLHGKSNLYNGSASRSKVVLAGLAASCIWFFVGIVMPILATFFLPLCVLLSSCNGAPRISGCLLSAYCIFVLWLLSRVGQTTSPTSDYLY